LRLASIDIGTNTLRLLICESHGRQLKPLYKDRVITRLGGGFLQKNRLITDHSIARSVDALKEFSNVIESYNVERLRAVATSVVRESANADAFSNRVRKETGINIEIISGAEEAKLTVLGVLKSVSVESRYKVIIDVGGGSTEFALLNGDVIEKIVSTDLGVVHLTEEFLSSESNITNKVQRLAVHVEQTINQNLSKNNVVSENNLTLFATAGTPTTLAAMEIGLRDYDAELVNGFVLKRSTMNRILNQLINLTLEERLKIVGLEKGREDVIIPGTLILLKSMDWFSKDEVIVSDGGLLEGIAIDMVYY